MRVRVFWNRRLDKGAAKSFFWFLLPENDEA